MERRIVDQGSPRLWQKVPGGRRDALPVAGNEQHNDIDKSGDDPEKVREEMPVPRHADSVTVARQSQPGGQITLVVIRRVEAVQRNFNRRKTDPFCAGSAVDVGVEPRVFPQDGKTAADDKRQQQEVGIMRQAQPCREAGTDCGGLQLRQCEDTDVRQTEQQILTPGYGDGSETQHDDQGKQRGADPDRLAAVQRVARRIPFRTVVLRAL